MSPEPVTQTRPFLSLCMIVKNEATNLPRCLQSAQPWVDEIIVVDTGSEDNTVAIAQQFGAKVSYFAWCNDFAAARNASLAQATGTWILVLDADEELVGSGDGLEPLRLHPEALTWEIHLRDADPEAGVNGMQAVRLLRNLPELRYTGQYHEYLQYQGQPIPLGQSQPLSGLEILHHGYSQAALQEKSPERIALLETIREREGLDLMLLRTLSGYYEIANQPERVQDCYLEVLARLSDNLLTGEPPTDTRALRSWLYSLGVRAFQSEDWETTRIICQRGLAWFPDFPPLYYLSGLMLKHLGFPLGAAPYFKRCLEFAQTQAYFRGEPFDEALITTFPARDLAEMGL
jgi:glycosyltransferase involved in cell wall biosynthesis